MLSKEQVRILRRSVKGVRMEELHGSEQDALRWLMEKGYCAADVRRSLDAIFATQEGQYALRTYEHEQLMERHTKRTWLRDAAMVLLGVVLYSLADLLLPLLGL